MDASRIPKEKAAFSNENGYVWTRPYDRAKLYFEVTFSSTSPS